MEWSVLFYIFCFIYLGFGVWQSGIGVGEIIDGGVVDGAGFGLAR